MIARTALPVTIASGTSLSTPVDLLGYEPVAISWPAAWTAAAITFQTSPDGVNWLNFFPDIGGEVSLTGGADRHVALSFTVRSALSRYIRIRSGTSGTPVNQAATRTLLVHGQAST